MKILGIDSSGMVASVAVVQDDVVIAEYTMNHKKTHSETLLPMIDEIMKTSETRMEELDAIAIASGPGSFTGIRIGISTVKGLAWAAEKPCVGVSTLAAMAWNGTAAGGLICAVMDARRSEVYNALFTIRSGRPVRLCPDRALSLLQLSEELSKYHEAPFLVGDGTEITAAFLKEQGINFRFPPENLRWQSAWGVAMEAAGQKMISSQELLPVYLRLSQAERERQARLQLKEKIVNSLA